MTRPAPENGLHRQSRTFTSFAGDTDLTAQSGVSKCAATGFLIFGGALAGTLVLKGEDGQSTTIGVGANQAVPFFQFAATTIVSSGTANIARVTAFWRTFTPVNP